jgi:hypothetical protein
MANKLPITKRLKDEIFVWDPTAFQGKGYWYILGKTGAYGRPASSAERIKLGSPPKSETTPVSPKVAFMDTPQLSQGGGRRRYRKRIKLAGTQDIRTGPLKEVIFQKWFNEGTPISEAIQQALSEKFKAKVATIKDKFDPLNMITKLVGDKAGAIIGRKMGRSEEDISRFTGYGDTTGARDSKLKALKGGKGIPNLERATYSSISEGQQKRMNKGSGLADVLARTYNILKKSYDEENKKSKANDKSKDTKDKWHRELIKAITGKKVVGGNKKLTISKEDEQTSSLEKLLDKLGWMRILSLGPVLGLVALLAGIGVSAYLLQKLANNKNNDKALSPDEAQAALQNGNPEDIEALGGRARLEDIIKNGKKRAQDVRAMPEGTPEEKEAKEKAIRDMGGAAKVKKIAEDTKEYSIPEVNSSDGKADKLPFTKVSFIGTGLAAKNKAVEWEKKYAPYYNDDGTKKKPIKSEEPPVTAVPVAAAAEPETAVKVIEKINQKSISDASASSQSNTPTSTSIPTASEVPANKNKSPALDSLSDASPVSNVPAENNTGTEVSAATQLNQDLSSTNNSGAIVADNSQNITIVNQNNDGLLVEELTGVRLDESTFRRITKQNLHMI